MDTTTQINQSKKQKFLNALSKTGTKIKAASLFSSALLVSVAKNYFMTPILPSAEARKEYNIPQIPITKAADHATKFHKHRSTLNLDKSSLKKKEFRHPETNYVSDKYDHYDPYSHTVDLNFDKYIKYKTNTKIGKFNCLASSATVKLDNNNKINLSLSENSSLLQHPEVISKIIYQYPESFKDLPARIISQDPQLFAKAFRDGVNHVRETGYLGLNEQGQPLTDDEYFDKMTKIGNDKKQEYNKRIDNIKNFNETLESF